MSHAQWNREMTRLLAIADRQPTRTLSALRKLTSVLEHELTTRVQDWHLAQTLQVMSLVQASSGDHGAAAATLQRVAERHEQELQYQRRAFVSACAAAALQFADNGDRSGARRILQKAAPLAVSLQPKDRLFQQARKIAGLRSARARRNPRQ